MTSVPRIFISYSRQDGAAAAAEIRERLAAEGLSLWQDLVAMEGGRDWWRQIEEAIGKAEYLVLLLTPKALESEVCAKEWRYARQQGTYVVPVTDSPPGKLELHRLAGWMRRADIVDFRIPERWTWLVGRLKQPPQIRRVPMMAEAPPSDFVPRPAEFAKLKAALLDPATKDAVAITAALKGAGGYGKTTLARALCADEEIQDAYHDGVLWVTLGENPGELLGRVEDLIAIVSGKRPEFAGIEAACVKLAELLAERRMLIVIDDAWSAADTHPFLLGGPHCARLITTRDSATLPRGAAEQPVDEMRGSEAVVLLRTGLPPGEDRTFRQLAARLGEWPLLLRLVNGALVDRVTRTRASLPDALAQVGKLLDKRGLTAFDAKNPKKRSEAVGKTLEVSLDRLDAGEQARLGELAVFPEDVQVPVRTVELLWHETAGLDEIDTAELLQRLFGLSLLFQLDFDRRFLQLHDVIRAWLRGQLGSGLAEMERSLVAAYSQACNGDWAKLTDDHYILDHLAMHLHSCDKEAWRRLLLNPAWIMRRLTPGSGRRAAILDDFLDTSDEALIELRSAIRDALQSMMFVGPLDLPGQLAGRLCESKHNEIREIVQNCRQAAPGPILIPRRASLANIPPLYTSERNLVQRKAIDFIQICPDGNSAYALSSLGHIELRCLSDGTTICSATLDEDRISHCTTDSQSNLIVAAKSGYIFCFSVDKLYPSLIHRASSNSIRGLSFDRTSDTLAWCSASHVYTLNTHSNRHQTFKLPRGQASALALLRGASSFLVGFRHGGLGKYSLHGGQEDYHIRSWGTIHELHIGAEDQVLCVRQEGIVELHDIDTGRLISRKSRAGGWAALATNGACVALLGPWNDLYVRQLPDFVQLARFHVGKGLRAVASASDRAFLAGDQYGNLHILDLVEPLPSAPGRV